jgi:outer membrane protein assembly factor BamB
MKRTLSSVLFAGCLALLIVLIETNPPAVAQGPGLDAAATVAKIGTSRGLCVVLGDSQGALELARASELLVYFQSPDAKQVETLRRSADEAGLLGKRLFVQQGPWTRIHLADNLADAVIVRGDATKATMRDDLLRVLRPQGKLLGADADVVKPFPKDIDEWSHPYHGPDNNPQSRDRLARAPYLTHFTAEPWYCPMPLTTVASGGRLFKVFGHIAVKEREWPLLNTLIAQNAFNGTILWKRPLTDGFMIHRNTLVATPTTLFLGDNKSCKLIDAATGEVKSEIVIPKEVGDGPVWKWLALVDGTLYAMIGKDEEPDPTIKGERLARGWPWGGTALGVGYNSKKYPWGFGNTILAIDPTTKKVLWSHQEKEPLDTRGMCMAAGRIVFYSHGKFLAALDAKNGKLLWKNAETELMTAIGEHKFAQNPTEGFSSTAYIKCNDQAIFFAGPTRPNLLAVSATDGKLLWQVSGRGNSQLVLRDDGLYAMSPKASTRYEPLSGKELQTLGPRINCTRATGSFDSIFVRGGRDGTIRYDLAGAKQQHICPVRPSCQDGVLPVYGHLYWGPWMCDCNLTLVGVIALEPAGSFDFAAKVNESERLTQGEGDGSKVADLPVTDADWPTLRSTNQRTAYTKATIPEKAGLQWTFTPKTALPATAPIAAGGLVFTAGADGAVRAFEAASGDLRWKTYTGAPVNYPPAVSQGRLYVGSGDGYVYALEAKTGRLLWRFRAAPQERTIPTYSALRSTWPVGSGVLVEDGVAYAAAGIANYDGTHVYALDVVSGRLRWHNGTSGSLHPDNQSGVSVNGHLLLHKKQLHLAGGNMVAVASYDLQNGKCLTDPLAPPSHTQFRAGSDLFVVGDKVAVSGPPLYSPTGDYRMVSEAILQTPAGDVIASLGPHNSTLALADPGAADKPKPTPKWVKKPVSRIYGLAIARNAIVVVGSHDPAKVGGTPTASVQALSIEDGRTLWQHTLPALPASWGVAADRNGRTIVTLQDGKVMCFGADK